MILSLFVVFLVVGLALAVLGLFVPNQSFLAIIGFFTLFVLAVFVILPGKLEYKTGEFTTDIYIYGDYYEGYHYDGYNQTLHLGTLNLFHHNQTNAIQYAKYEDNTTHYIGYWLAICASLGMFGVLYSIYSTNWNKER